MLAGLVLVLSVWIRTPDDLPFLLFSILTAAFIIYTHRGNLQRMLAGTENRARKVWLLRPRSS
jgi:glycerol-3-phosphate acyltransferase PlsY